MPVCRSCGKVLTDRYETYGVCQSCYFTTDDPDREKR